MSASRRSLRLILALVIAFVLHIAFDNALRIGAAVPNLATTTLLIACLFIGPNEGAALGFLTGLLEGAYVSRVVGSFLVTRSLAGFFVGALEDRLFRDNLFVAMLTVFVGSALTDGCFFLFAPHPHALRWLIQTGLGSLYDAALAIPLYFLLRRIVRGGERE